MRRTSGTGTSATARAARSVLGLAPRLRPADRAGGFTLIEILAVVAIVGIVLFVAALNLFPSDAQVARREAADVALDLEYARDAAWFGGLPTSVTFGDGHVRKWRYLGGEWRADTARDRRLASEVAIVAVHVDGQPLDAGERLIFLPDGLGIPFRVAFQVRGRPYAVEGDAAGAVRLVE